MSIYSRHATPQEPNKNDVYHDDIITLSIPASPIALEAKRLDQEEKKLDFLVQEARSGSMVEFRKAQEEYDINHAKLSKIKHQIDSAYDISLLAISPQKLAQVISNHNTKLLLNLTGKSQGEDMGSSFDSLHSTLSLFKISFQRVATADLVDFQIFLTSALAHLLLDQFASKTKLADKSPSNYKLPFGMNFQQPRYDPPLLSIVTKSLDILIKTAQLCLHQHKDLNGFASVALAITHPAFKRVLKKIGRLPSSMTKTIHEYELALSSSKNYEAYFKLYHSRSDVYINPKINDTKINGSPMVPWLLPFASRVDTIISSYSVSNAKISGDFLQHFLTTPGQERLEALEAHLPPFVSKKAILSPQPVLTHWLLSLPYLSYKQLWEASRLVFPDLDEIQPPPNNSYSNFLTFSTYLSEKTENSDSFVDLTSSMIEFDLLENRKVVETENTKETINEVKDENDLISDNDTIKDKSIKEAYEIGDKSDYTQDVDNFDAASFVSGMMNNFDVDFELNLLLEDPIFDPKDLDRPEQKGSMFFESHTSELDTGEDFDFPEIPTGTDHYKPPDTNDRNSSTDVDQLNSVKSSIKSLSIFDLSVSTADSSSSIDSSNKVSSDNEKEAPNHFSSNEGADIDNQELFTDEKVENMIRNLAGDGLGSFELISETREEPLDTSKPQDLDDKQIIFKKKASSPKKLRSIDVEFDEDFLELVEGYGVIMSEVAKSSLSLDLKTSSSSEKCASGKASNPPLSGVNYEDIAFEGVDSNKEKTYVPESELPEVSSLASLSSPKTHNILKNKKDIYFLDSTPQHCIIIPKEARLDENLGKNLTNPMKKSGLSSSLEDNEFFEPVHSNIGITDELNFNDSTGDTLIIPYSTIGPQNLTNNDLNPYFPTLDLSCENSLVNEEHKSIFGLDHKSKVLARELKNEKEIDTSRSFMNFDNLRDNSDLVIKDSLRGSSEEIKSRHQTYNSPLGVYMESKLDATSYCYEYNIDGDYTDSEDDTMIPIVSIKGLDPKAQQPFSLPCSNGTLHSDPFKKYVYDIIGTAEISEDYDPLHIISINGIPFNNHLLNSVGHLSSLSSNDLWDSTLDKFEIHSNDPFFDYHNLLPERSDDNVEEFKKINLFK